MRLIDADALIEAINTWPKFGVDGRGRIVPWNEGYELYVHLGDVVIAITGMPAIEPERKKGKWEIINLGAVGVFDSCSECKRVVKHKAPFYNFCPNCGSDNRGEEDEQT